MRRCWSVDCIHENVGTVLASLVYRDTFPHPDIYHSYTTGWQSSLLFCNCKDWLLLADRHKCETLHLRQSSCSLIGRLVRNISPLSSSLDRPPTVSYWCRSSVCDGAEWRLLWNVLCERSPSQTVSLSSHSVNRILSLPPTSINYSNRFLLLYS